MHQRIRPRIVLADVCKVQIMFILCLCALDPTDPHEPAECVIRTLAIGETIHNTVGVLAGEPDGRHPQFGGLYRCTQDEKFETDPGSASC
jgi:hypothetical protein